LNGCSDCRGSLDSDDPATGSPRDVENPVIYISPNGDKLSQFKTKTWYLLSATSPRVLLMYQDFDCIMQI